MAFDSPNLRGELAELGSGKPPGEMLPDAAQVEGSGPAKPGVAGRRQDRPCPAAVRRAVSALDQPDSNQPVDQPRDPTAAQPNPSREFGHPEPAIPGHPELCQDIELGQRHPLASHELGLEAA